MNEIIKNGRVRRLTPLESWRLFDFADKDFYAAKKKLEDTYYKGRDRASSQLYKQAGNTIIIGMLERALKPLNLSGHIEVLELFGGIGAPRKALERLGINFNIADYVEIDKYAVTSYNGIFNENYEPQDVTKWDKDITVDIIFHGSPCQDMSVAGKHKGADEGSGTRSSLMHETKRIVKKTNPKYVLWENVRGAISPKNIHNFEKYVADLDALGYNTYWQILNGIENNTPQNRERIIAISIRKDIDTGYEFLPPVPLTETLADRLEDNVEEKYYINQELTDKLLQKILNKQVSDCVRGGGQVLNRHRTLLGHSGRQGIVLQNQGKEYVRDTDIALCILSRDYKGLGNQQMTAVLEINN